MGKDEWKNTGKELGDAFQGLAKSLIRSAKEGVEQAEEWAESDGTAQEPKQEEESTVFNDGTWRKTGKELGNAFRNLGKTILDTGADAAENINKDE